jgi:hypothetical protein
LHSIANLSAGLSAAIDLSVFSIADIHQPEYWSSTTRVEYPSHAWYVSFGNGGMYIKDKNDKFYVRCIRGGSESDIWSLSFSIIGDGTVVHQTTGLTWQQEDDDTVRNWEQALNNCESKTLGGYSDWRLPNIKELNTVVNYSRVYPSINSTVFQNTKFSDYWSSTTSYGDNAWVIGFDHGGTSSSNSKNSTFYVRCIRGGQ